MNDLSGYGMLEPKLHERHLRSSSQHQPCALHAQDCNASHIPQVTVSCMWSGLCPYSIYWHCRMWYFTFCIYHIPKGDGGQNVSPCRSCTHTTHAHAKAGLWETRNLLMSHMLKSLCATIPHQAWDHHLSAELNLWQQTCGNKLRYYKIINSLLKLSLKIKNYNHVEPIYFHLSFNFNCYFGNPYAMQAASRFLHARAVSSVTRGMWRPCTTKISRSQNITFVTLLRHVFKLAAYVKTALFYVGQLLHSTSPLGSGVRSKVRAARTPVSYEQIEYTRAQPTKTT